MKSLSMKKESHRKELIIDLFKSAYAILQTMHSVRDQTHCTPWYTNRYMIISIEIEYLSNNPPKDSLEEHEQIEECLSKIIKLEKG